MSSIPDEVYLEILQRVPARSTFVCKCVCKTWLSVISNPNFVKSHLDLSIQKKNTHLIFSGIEELINSIPHDSLLSLISQNPVEMETPFSQSFRFDYFQSMSSQFPPLDYFYVFVSGSCNGIVCLRCTDDEKELFCLWNPATLEYKELPYSPKVVDDYKSVSFIAFGYDSKSDDYKLIQGKCSYGWNYNSMVQVYSLRSNSWETIRNIPYSFTDLHPPVVLVNGYFHWLGKMGDKLSPELIITLDISDVKFRELQLPKEPLEKGHLFMNLGELDGCLCVIVDINKICFEVWVMQEYGVRESWAKRYIVDYVRVTHPHRMVRIVLSFKSGEILFGFEGDPFLYDPEYGSIRELSISGLEAVYEEVSYFESLVTLNSGTYAGRETN